MTTLSYSFGDSNTPTHTYTGAADVDVKGDGSPDGIYLDFDGSGHKDAIAWDSDGDGRVDTILVSSGHDGVYDTAYYDPSGRGHWDASEPYAGESGGEVDTAATLTYSFGDATTPTETYTGKADFDVNSDGHPDAIWIDFTGVGGKNSLAWDSDGDGRVDAILVSSKDNGVFDTVYTDPGGNGHWNHAEPFTGYDTYTGSAGGGAAHESAETESESGGDYPADAHTYQVGGDDDPYAHVAGDGDLPGQDAEADLHLS